MRGIWHTSFTVADLEASLAFYCGLLGLELVHRQVQHNEYTARLVGFEGAHLEVAMLCVPGEPVGPSGHHLELVEYRHPRGCSLEAQTNQPGAPHLAFVADDIHADFARLKSQGVRFKAEEPVAIEAGVNKGGFTIYFLDPDGITLEMVQPPRRLDASMAPSIQASPPRPEKPRPIVAIGTGSIVKVGHWPAYRMAGFPIFGAYDPRQDVAQALAQEFEVKNVFKTLQEAIRNAPEDAVFDVAVPASAILEVLDEIPSGRAVLLQKPMGENLSQALQIREKALAKNLKTAVNFQLRYAPYCLAARSLIEQGAIGNLHEIEVHVNVHMPWELWDFLEKAPRMEIVYHSIHYLDLIRSFMGEPQGVMAKTIKHPFSPKMHSSRTSAILDYGDWARANVYTNHGHVYGKRHQDASVRLEGDKGCIKFQMGLIMNYPDGEPDWLEYVSEGMPDWRRVELKGSWFPDAFIGTMGSLMRHLDDPAEALPTGLEDALKTMELVERCYLSSEA